ncbi:hypothetical protein LBMAG42_50910 [Deltaproteobacteria bacterium]|nr:hypothetical protein LBMAG42_50910 [Deltaproteobacteria bacterium]
MGGATLIALGVPARVVRPHPRGMERKSPDRLSLRQGRRPAPRFSGSWPPTEPRWGPKPNPKPSYPASPIAPNRFIPPHFQIANTAG